MASMLRAFAGSTGLVEAGAGELFGGDHEIGLGAEHGQVVVQGTVITDRADKQRLTELELHENQNYRESDAHNRGNQP
jgi:hypothetical protein